jgi:hypothetical protein
VTTASIPAGARVVLLVGYLAWPTRTKGGDRQTTRRRAATWLSPSGKYTLVGYRDAGGGCVIADERGDRWVCPVDFIAEVVT